MNADVDEGKGVCILFWPSTFSFKALDNSFWFLGYNNVLSFLDQNNFHLVEFAEQLSPLAKELSVIEIFFHF